MLPNGPRADDVVVNGSREGRKRQGTRCGTALGSTRLQKSVAFRHSADGLGPDKLGQGDGNERKQPRRSRAIHDLFTRYCCALDDGEIEAVVDCFTVDAILKSPVIDISGRDEIRAFAGRFAAQRAAGMQFRHMVGNIAVTITGNRAAASAYLLVLISKDQPARPPRRL